MAVAYTSKPTAYLQIAANPPLTFLSNLKALLLSVGWVWVSAYDNGDLYQIESPQHLKARVRIWYPNSTAYPNCFAIQMQSANFPATVGFTHHFLAGYTGPDSGAVFSSYAVWANCCQLFIGAVHTAPWYGNLLRAVQCGVPYTLLPTEVTPECEERGTTPPITNELFWSSGDDTGSGWGVFTSPPSLANFRNSFFCQRYTLYHDTTDMSNNAGTPYTGVEAQLLQLCILRSNYYWNALTNTWPEGFVRQDLTPLAYDPLLASQGFIFGQLWDAVLVSKPMALEAREDIIETEPKEIFTKWSNYSLSHSIQISFSRDADEGRCYALLLLLEPPEITDLTGAGMNVAY